MAIALTPQTWMTTNTPPPPRRMLHLTSGRGHGDIVRLMSPSDLGEQLKPFVFLDRFDTDIREMSARLAMHPHSGIGTVTVFTDGDVTFDDPAAGRGTLGFGAVEWMRAGGGVWHGKELSAGASQRVRGFQLWVALPPEMETGPAESQYIEAQAMPHAGPVRLILGVHEGLESPVGAPADVNYLLVRLHPGQSWSYAPPLGHAAAWLALAAGDLLAAEGRIPPHAMAVFENAEGPIELQAGATGATFVLGSARPHPQALHLGHYSVHTSPEALEIGEARIAALGERLWAAGDLRTASGSVPIFR
jgi:redox-sensitive bicupin YhaK (pirin superfamily)